MHEQHRAVVSLADQSEEGWWDPGEMLLQPTVVSDQCEVILYLVNFGDCCRQKSGLCEVAVAVTRTSR